MTNPVADPSSVLAGLLALRRLTALYPDGHPIVGRKVDEVFNAVQELLHGQASVSIDIVRGEVYVDGTPVAEASASPVTLQEFVELRTGSLQFRAGLQHDELLRAAAFLNTITENPKGDPIETRLAARGIRHVSFYQIVLVDTRLDIPRLDREPPKPWDPAYASALERIEETFNQATAGHGLDAAAIGAVVRLLITDVARSNTALAQILAIKQYENLTYCHSVNVAVLSLLLGRRIGLNEDTVSRLVEVALLHDIGKTRIPLELLQKPGALEPAEWAQIERHTTLGAELLLETPGVDALAPVVALEHHRGWKGTGYPDLGEGVTPHLMSQIVSVADIFEALTGARSYRQPMQPDQACLVLSREAGSKLNPAFVKTFIAAVTFFPVGSWVRTDRGDVAIVIRTNDRDPLHPVIRIVDRDLEVVGEVDTAIRNDAGAYTTQIMETLAPQCSASKSQKILTHIPRSSLSASM